jgi:hypothetical protein
MFLGPGIPSACHAGGPRTALASEERRRYRFGERESGVLTVAEPTLNDAREFRSLIANSQEGRAP